MDGQVIQEDTDPEVKDGKITTPRDPKPSQGEGDPSEIPGREHETGAEGDGT